MVAYTSKVNESMTLSGLNKLSEKVMMKDMEHKSGCLICGCNLVYSDGEKEQICSICGHTFNANVHCSNNHFICDSCHSLSAIEYIDKYCKGSCRKDFRWILRFSWKLRCRSRDGNICQYYYEFNTLIEGRMAVE